MSMKLTFGCDPEFFVKDKSTNKIVSAFNLGVPGTKEEPHKFSKGIGAVQVDGMALEVNPAPTSYYSDPIARTVALIKTIHAEFLSPDNYELHALPSYEFDKEYFDGLGDEAKALGCDPDFNAWTQQENEAPDADNRTRMGAGHIHIGWTKNEDVQDPEHIADCIAVVRQLDWAVGMRTFLWDKDIERRKIYGRLGNYRPKPYGVEYRTPSNAWLRSPSLGKKVFRDANDAVRDLLNNKIYKQDQELMQDMFDRCMADGSNKHVKFLNREFNKHALGKSYFNEWDDSPARWQKEDTNLTNRYVKGVK